MDNGVRTEQTRALEIAARAIADAPTTETMIQTFCSAAASSMPTISGGLLLYGRAGDYAAITGIWEAGGSWVGGLRGMRQHKNDPSAGACLAALTDLPPERRITMPLRALGMSVGELRLWSPTGGKPDPDETALLGLLASTLAACLSGARVQSRARESSVRDAVTGLFNRRYLEETLLRECHRCGRERRPLGLIHLDLDGFGDYNARFGRHAGDRLLQGVAGLIQASFRGSDLSARLDAGQFVIALPDADLHHTSRRGNDLVALVRDLRMEQKGRPLPGITASVGVAEYPGSVDDAGELLTAADSARLLARQAGGDRVQAAERVE